MLGGVEGRGKNTQWSNIVAVSSIFENSNRQALKSWKLPKFSQFIVDKGPKKIYVNMKIKANFKEKKN